MKKLILAITAIVLSLGAFAQNDTFKIKGKIPTGYYNGYSNSLNEGLMPTDADLNTTKKETITNSKRKPKMKPDAAHNGMRDKMDHKMMNKSTEKHVMMQDGKVVIMRKGVMQTVKSYTPLSNGTKVMSNGTIRKKDGSETMLKEGECLNMAGELVAMNN